jgi:multiple sugar transport system permease protein
MRSAVLYGVLTLAGLVIVIPFFWMLATSFKPAPEIIARPPTLLPVAFTLGNFGKVFKRVAYFRSLFNSLFIAGMTTSITIFFSTMVGYGIAKFRSRGLNVVLYLILSALMLPPFLVAIPLYIGAANLGMINSLWAVIIPFSISNFGIFLMRQFCLSIPDDLLAAARIDGASEMAILLRIVFPVVSAGCAALGILKFLMTWNDFFFPLIMLTSEKKMTLQIILSTFIDFEYYTDFGIVMALTSLIVLPVIVLFVFFQKDIIEGVALSGIKG